MSSNADIFLKKTLGEDFMESLSKVELWKPGTRSTLDHEEIRTALQIVPRTVMALLIKELSPMAIGEIKEVELFMASNAKMRVNKHERDVYSGEIEHENKKVAEFKMRSLPGIGLVIMTAFELYDMENLINSNSQVESGSQAKVQAMIDERIALHSMIDQVVERKMAHKDAVHNMMLMKLTDELRKEKDAAANLAYKIEEVRRVQEQSTPQSDPYFRDMTNGIEVVNSVVNKKEPEFVEAPKKRPLKDFLESRNKKKEYEVKMVKSETVDCSDCGKNIFDGKIFSGCICLGDDRDRKVFIKKSEDGIKIRFSKGFDPENIEMLLDMLRKKHD
jgi:hypothetical protein